MNQTLFVNGNCMKCVLCRKGPRQWKLCELRLVLDRNEKWIRYLVCQNRVIYQEYYMNWRILYVGMECRIMPHMCSNGMYHLMSYCYGYGHVFCNCQNVTMSYCCGYCHVFYECQNDTCVNQIPMNVCTHLVYMSDSLFSIMFFFFILMYMQVDN